MVKYPFVVKLILVKSECLAVQEYTVRMEELEWVKDNELENELAMDMVIQENIHPCSF